MEKVGCTKCSWEGDKNGVIWGDDGSAWCPNCRPVEPIQDLRYKRIEEKLDHIIKIVGVISGTTIRL